MHQRRMSTRKGGDWRGERSDKFLARSDDRWTDWADWAGAISGRSLPAAPDTHIRHCLATDHREMFRSRNQASPLTKMI